MSNPFRMARMQVGLSQEQAAPKLGVHGTTLNKYENGHRYPSGKVLQRMAEVYGVSINELLGDKEENDSMYRQKFEEAQAEIIKLQQQIIDLTSSQ